MRSRRAWLTPHHESGRKPRECVATQGRGNPVIAATTWPMSDTRLSADFEYFNLTLLG